jgi:hypothetical protein
MGNPEKDSGQAIQLSTLNGGMEAEYPPLSLQGGESNCGRATVPSV